MKAIIRSSWLPASLLKPKWHTSRLQGNISTFAMASQPTNTHFYRRILPETCISFCSEEGRQIFTEALTSGHMTGYFNLAAQFRTQDEPAFCGLSTLVMALNALEVDPQRIWKGVWRWYHENMLDCCVPLKQVTKTGITMEQFSCLASCNLLNVKMTYGSPSLTDNILRQAVINSTQCTDEILIASYSRRTLGQTGNGHFSPIGGYHPTRDLVLVMDTARFKYPPHWVPLPQLCEAMKQLDKDTGRTRGFFLLSKSLQGTPLLLFRIASQLGVTVPESLPVSQDLQNFLKHWIAWLQEPVIATDQSQESMELPSSASLQHSAVRALQQMLPSEICSVLSTQLAGACGTGLSNTFTYTLSAEHINALKSMDASLRSLPIYSVVTDVLGEYPAQNVPSTNPSNDACSSLQWNCQMSEYRIHDSVHGEVLVLTQAHFYTVLLLSWPYTKCASSRGLLLKQHMLAATSEGHPALQNEINQLKHQFTSVFSFLDKCEECCCPGIQNSVTGCT